METVNGSLLEAQVVGVETITRIGESSKVSGAKDKEMEKDFIQLFSRNLSVSQNPLSHWECTE